MDGWMDAWVSGLVGEGDGWVEGGRDWGKREESTCMNAHIVTYIHRIHA